jgi:hypothetical protein
MAPGRADFEFAMGASCDSTVLYVVATELTKRWFYRGAA